MWLMWTTNQKQGWGQAAKLIGGAAGHEESGLKGSETCDTLIVSIKVLSGLQWKLQSVFIEY